MSLYAVARFVVVIRVAFRRGRAGGTRSVRPRTA